MLFLLPDAPYPHMKVQLLFFRLSAQFSVFFPTFVKYSRQEYPNAYLPWTEAEDLELTRLWCEGATEEELSTHFRRKPGAIRSRITKLDLERLYGKHRPF